MIRILGCILGARGDDARGDDARGHDAQYRCGSGVHPQDALEDAHPKHRGTVTAVGPGAGLGAGGLDRDSARPGGPEPRTRPGLGGLGLGPARKIGNSLKSYQIAYKDKNNNIFL